MFSLYVIIDLKNKLKLVPAILHNCSSRRDHCHLAVSFSCICLPCKTARVKRSCGCSWDTQEAWAGGVDRGEERRPSACSTSSCTSGISSRISFRLNEKEIRPEIVCACGSRDRPETCC